MRGERGIHDVMVQAGFAAAAAQDEGQVASGFGEQVPALEPAAAVHHEHPRGDVDGRQSDVDHRDTPGAGSLGPRRGRTQGATRLRRRLPRR
ncbi:hypothetical protein [Streptomyces sp. C10]|uniref:hypothetical protein n=1 Tax=Streptomyces sp. C10 TaxID=531941 RepID=UPI00397FF09E